MANSDHPSYGELKLDLIQTKQDLNRAKEALAGKYTEFHCQRNFIFSSQFSRLIIIRKILWLIIIYIVCLSFCIIRSCFHVHMRGYSHSSIKKLFPCCTCTRGYFFKNLYTFKLLEDRPVRVCKMKYLNLQRNARNLEITFGTRSSDVSKGSTPLYQEIDAIVAVTHMLYFAKATWPDGRKSIGTVINLLSQ